MLPLDVSVHIQVTNDTVSKLMSLAFLTGPRHGEHNSGYKRVTETPGLSNSHCLDILDKIPALTCFDGPQVRHTFICKPYTRHTLRHA